MRVNCRPTRLKLNVPPAQCVNQRRRAKNLWTFPRKWKKYFLTEEMRSLGRNALMLVLLCYSLHSGKKKKKKQTRGILCVKKSAKIRKREHNLLQMYSNAKAHAANGNKVVSLSSDCTALPHTSVTLAPCKFSRLREHSINSSARFDPLLQILNTQSSESRR